MSIIHKDIPAGECHEAKQIIGATTADAGKVITPSASAAGTGSLRNLVEQEVVIDRHTITGLSTQSLDVEALKKSVISLGVNAGETVTVVLGNPGTAILRRVTVVKNDSATGEIRVQSPTGNINGYPYVYLKRQYESITFITDGAAWHVLSSNINASGYQFIRDAQYTSGAPLSVAAGVRTKGTLNGLGTGQGNYKDSRYDLFDETNSRILFTKPGDVLSIRLAWRAKMSASNGYFDLETSFPAPTTGTNITTEIMAKGAGSENRFIREYSFYIDEFAMSQGYLEIWLTPSVNMDFYGASLLITVDSVSTYGGNE